jgi:hypothetical protein
MVSRMGVVERQFLNNIRRLTTVQYSNDHPDRPTRAAQKDGAETVALKAAAAIRAQQTARRLSKQTGIGVVVARI